MLGPATSTLVVMYFALDAGAVHKFCCAPIVHRVIQYSSRRSSSPRDIEQAEQCCPYSAATLKYRLYVTVVILSASVDRRIGEMCQGVSFG